jgi:hypothetical protein
MKRRFEGTEGHRRMEEIETSERYGGYGIRYCVRCKKWFRPFKFKLHKLWCRRRSEY